MSICCMLRLALGRDDIERIGTTRIGTAIFGNGRVKQTTIVKKGTGDENVLEVVSLQPNGKGLGWKAPVAHGEYAFAAWLVGRLIDRFW